MAVTLCSRALHNRVRYLLHFIQKRHRVKTKWATSYPKVSSADLALGYFDSTYNIQLGELWPSVRIGLLSERKYGALVNNFSSGETISYLQSIGCQDFIASSYQISEVDATLPPRPDCAPSEVNRLSGAVQSSAKATISTSIKCYVFPKGDISRFKPARPDSAGLLSYYLMDAASVLPVMALNVNSGDAILDLCAAPGGKTLALLQAATPRCLCVNDWAPARASRLHRTLKACLPSELLSEERLIMTSFDGRQMRNDWETTFDKVLVDVPCTTDRHSLVEADNNIFSRSRTRERQTLPLSQTQLLLSGLQMVRKGGYVVYSTCTLSHLQNQCVVEQAINLAQQELGISVAVVDIQPFVNLFKDTFYFAPEINQGALVLPHLTANYGPIYFCKLQRLD